MVATTADSSGDDAGIQPVGPELDFHLPLVPLVETVLHDLQQLFVLVIPELDLAGEPTGDAGVVGEECFHLLVVASEDEHNLARQVLHLRQKEVEDLPPTRAVSGCELVGFVDEHGAAPVVEDAVDLLLAILDAVTSKARAGRLDEVATGQRADGCEKLCVEPRNRCFPYEAISNIDHGTMRD